MPLRVSALGLPASYPDAEVLPKIPVSGARAVGPLVLAYTKPAASGTAEPPGAAAPAQAGQVVAVTPNVAQIAELGPLILASPLRSLAPKVGNVDVLIVGAEALAQGENLEGTSVTIRIDGAAGVASGGSPAITVAEGPDGASVIFVNGRGPRIAVGET